MDYFFTYETDLPAGVGYELFHTEHFIILALCFAVTAAGIFLYRRLKGDSHRSVFRRILAVASVLLILIRLLYVYLCGARLLYDLPLHFCSIAGMICFIYEFLIRRMPGVMHSMAEQVLYSLCLAGAVLALVFSDGTAYPPVHFVTIQSTLFHVLIILYVAAGLSDGSISPSFKKAYLSVLFLVILVPPILIFDMYTRTDYMFLLYPSAGSPLAGAFIRYGYAGYMLFYGLAVVTEIYMINLLSPLFKTGRRGRF